MRNGLHLQRIYTYLKRRQCFSVSVCTHPLTRCLMKAKLTILHCHTMCAFNKNLVNKCNTRWILDLKLLPTSKVSKPGFTTQSELSKGWEPTHLKCCPDDSDPQGRLRIMHLIEPLWNVWKPLQWPQPEWPHPHTQCCTHTPQHTCMQFH